MEEQYWLPQWATVHINIYVNQYVTFTKVLHLLIHLHHVKTKQMHLTAKLKHGARPLEQV